MKKQNKKSKKEVLDINYLDLIPVRAEELQWFTDRRDRIVLKVENTGLFNKIAQKVFNKPQFTKVHLDQQGTSSGRQQSRFIRGSSNISRLLRAIIS